MQKAGCPNFQKAGCPIFKNSGCRLTGRVMSHFKWKIFSNFVAFSEYPNFNVGVKNLVEGVCPPCFRHACITHCAVVLSDKKDIYLCQQNHFYLQLYDQTKKYLSLSTEAFLPFTVFKNFPTDTIIAIFRVSVSRRFKRLGKW